MNRSRFFSLTPAFSPTLSREYDRPQVFFDPNTGGNDPGGDNNNPPSPQSQNPPAAQSQQPNIEEAVDNRIAELLGSKKANNDPMAALTISLKAQHKLEGEIERLKRNQASESDQANLKAANSLLQSYGAKDFTELKKLLDDGKTAITERDGLKKSTSMRSACEAAGLDYDDFSSRKGVDDWSYETKTEDQGGKAVKVATVTFTDDKGKEVTKSLADHAAAKFPTLAKANANPARQQGGKLIKQGVNGGQAETTAERIRREEEEQRNRRGRGGSKVTAGEGEAGSTRRTIFDRRRR